jgi:hypothetical protein
VFLAKYYQNYQIKECKIGRAFNMHGRKEKIIQDSDRKTRRKEIIRKN